MRKFFIPAIILALGVQLGPWAQPANARPRVSFGIQEHGNQPYGVIGVNDEVVAVFRRPAGSIAPAERARICAERLEEIIRHGIIPCHVAASKANGGDWSIALNGARFLEITPDDAAVQRTTPAALAHSWADAFQRLLEMPILMPSAKALRIPLGETRGFTIGGEARGAEISVAVDTSDVITAQYDPVTRAVTTQGIHPGKATLVIQTTGEDQALESIPVAVLKNAGQIRSSISMDVTGDPGATQDVLIDAYGSALTEAVVTEPDVQIQIAPAPRFPTHLKPGATMRTRQRVRLSGADLLPVEGVTEITLTNRVVPRGSPTWLLYSNNPEQVSKSQILFRSVLAQAQPQRLVYHHQNTSGAPLFFHIDLINETDQVAEVQEIKGISSPGVDTVQVGRRAGAAFFHAEQRGAGVMHRIPPHTRVTLLAQRCAKDLTVSGIVQLHQITGSIGSVSVEVSAETAEEFSAPPLARLTARLSSTCEMSVPNAPVPLQASGRAPLASPYVFSAPEIAVENTYTVGSQWSYIRIGQSDALKDASGKMRLFGNYGAAYEIHVTLVNPDVRAHPVGVFFAAEAGDAAGVFQIDHGIIQEFDAVSPPDERLLARYTLGPGQTKKTVIKTIPLNGSSYPVSVVVHVL